MLHDEAELIRQRLNGELATTATLTRAAVAAVIDREAGKDFNKLVKSLTEE